MRRFFEKKKLEEATDGAPCASLSKGRTDKIKNSDKNGNEATSITYGDGYNKLEAFCDFFGIGIADKVFTTFMQNNSANFYIKPDGDITFTKKSLDIFFDTFKSILPEEGNLELENNEEKNNPVSSLNFKTNGGYNPASGSQNIFELFKREWTYAGSKDSSNYINVEIKEGTTTYEILSGGGTPTFTIHLSGSNIAACEFAGESNDVSILTNVDFLEIAESLAFLIALNKRHDLKKRINGILNGKKEENNLSFSDSGIKTELEFFVHSQDNETTDFLTRIFDDPKHKDYHPFSFLAEIAQYFATNGSTSFIGSFISPSHKIFRKKKHDLFQSVKSITDLSRDVYNPIDVFFIEESDRVKAPPTTGIEKVEDYITLLNDSLKSGNAIGVSLKKEVNAQLGFFVKDTNAFKDLVNDFNVEVKLKKAGLGRQLFFIRNEGHPRSKNADGLVLTVRTFGNYLPGLDFTSISKSKDEDKKDGSKRKTNNIGYVPKGPSIGKIKELFSHQFNNFNVGNLIGGSTTGGQFAITFVESLNSSGSKKTLREKKEKKGDFFGFSLSKIEEICRKNGVIAGNILEKLRGNSNWASFIKICKDLNEFLIRRDSILSFLTRNQDIKRDALMKRTNLLSDIDKEIFNDYIKNHPEEVKEKIWQNLKIHWGEYNCFLGEKKQSVFKFLSNEKNIEKGSEFLIDALCFFVCLAVVSFDNSFWQEIFRRGTKSSEIYIPNMIMICERSHAPAGWKPPEVREEKKAAYDAIAKKLDSVKIRVCP